MNPATEFPVFRFPAIRVQQPIGTFWAASIPADILLETTVPDPLRVVIDPEFGDRSKRPDFCTTSQHKMPATGRAAS